MGWAIWVFSLMVGIAGVAEAATVWEENLETARGAVLPVSNQADLGKLTAEILNKKSPFSSACTSQALGNYSGSKAIPLANRIQVLREDYRNVRETADELRMLAKTAIAFKNASTSGPQLLTIMEKPAAAAETRCERAIVQLERELRTEGREVERNIAALNKQIVLKSTDDAAGAALKKELTKNQKALVWVKETISFTDSGDLLKTFDDYDSFYYKFNLGFEYATVKTVFQKGFPRIGFLLYHQYTGESARIRDREPGWKFLREVHTSLAARLTSSAEVPTKENTGAGDPTINLGDKPSLEYDIQAFLPVGKTMNFGNLYSEIGPLLLYGGSKTDDINQIHQRYYAGLRLGMSPEVYTDVLFGKTESLQSKRLEIRGQMPIYRTVSGTPIVIGAIANLGLRKINSTTYKEADSIRIYVSWDIDMKDIFKVFNPPGQ